MTISEQSVKVTNEGLDWLTTGDSEYLAKVFHYNIRFIGEILHEVRETGSPTHIELMDIALGRYRLNWKSDTQLRTRTSWLRTLGALDFFDGRLHLTESGHRVLSMLELGSPVHSEDSSLLSIRDPSPSVARLLQDLDDGTLAARTRSFYLPKESAEKGKLDALSDFSELAIERTRIDNIIEYCISEHRISRDSAQSVFNTLRTIGLVSRISSDSCIATPAARAWLEGRNPLDIARMVHAKIWYFGEILQDLDNPDIGSHPAVLAVQSGRYHAEGRGIDRTAVNSRMTLLVACGLVEKLTKTDYRVTTVGRLFRSTLRCEEPIFDSLAEPSPAGRSRRTRRPGKTDSQRQFRHEKSIEEKSSVAEDRRAEPEIFTAETLAAELESASIDSANHERLEHATVAAFNYLGMPSKHMGGRGNADGIVRTGIGVNAQTFTLETKSASKASVSEESANLLGLPEHREKVSASLTLLIGPGFDRRVLKATDQDPYIAVILVSSLAEAIRRQSVTPATVEQLKPLVDPTLTCTQRDAALSKLWLEESHRSALERMLVQILEEEALNPFQEDGWLDVTSIRRELRRFNFSASEEEVLSGLNFLASARISVVEESDHGYRCAMPKDAIFRRIHTIGRQWHADR
ncbi:hypothetical protein FHY52_00870 [Nocardia nova]|uniref:hypothetical protein n=1 Tax=Nocardia nova TaxID=37330 RepID=UPI0025AF529E|nr:hypothetical protein [Nocardia nova]MDN2495277.1 hypothetical protein [Nocardia nova]